MCNVPIMAGLAGAFCATAALAQNPDPVWVKENNRLQNPSTDVSGFALGVNDQQEKDYQWGDLNLNGWVDLVVMRKQPFTSAGKRQNQLYMNENGILVDRTAQYASAVDHSQIVTSPGWAPHTNYPTDQGFLTPTNDRMAALADFTGNGYLDIVTATTMSIGDPKHIGHPRLYVNLGSPSGSWEGFRFENARIPAMQTWSGATGWNPRFCSVAAGDLTGDGWPDIFFGDYDNATGAPNQQFGEDFNDKFLVNAGASNPGFFTDQTSSRFSGVVNIPGATNQPFPVSAFGAANGIADLNGDGNMDIFKQTSLQAPTYVGVAYNLDGDGVFKSGSYYQVPTTGAPYFVSAADLNNNGRLDLVITDDFTDRYILNLSTNANGTVSWTNTINFPGPSGFASNSTVVPLRYHQNDPNAWNDVIIADVDIDIPGCTRITHIYRNNENGTNVTFSSMTPSNQPSNQIIPASERQGTFHVAAFDITGNGWIDTVWGRCSGTNVWITQPPSLPPGLNVTYPAGLPSVLVSEEPTEVLANLTPINGQLDSGSVTLHISVNGGPFSQQAMTNSGGGAYTGTIPALECDDVVAYYISADVAGESFSDPATAPADTHSAIAIAEIVNIVAEDFAGGAGDWTVAGSPSLGQWVVAEPTGAIQAGALAAPDNASLGTNAFVTCPGCDGGSCTATCKVLDGPAHLLSPTLDLNGADAIITYDRWVYSRTGDDYLSTWVSNDNGATWVFVHESNGTNANWQTASFAVSDYVTPTAQVRVRFTADEDSQFSTHNAGIDNFNVDVLDCGDQEPVPTCPGDLTGDDNVNVFDLLELLSAWGPCADCGSCAADLTGDCNVNVFDLLELLSAWGPCPQ